MPLPPNSRRLIQVCRRRLQHLSPLSSAGGAAGPRSWPDALDSLHRILLGYENATKQQIETENRYRTIFEDAPVGIFQLDAQGRPLSLNNALARILGYDSPELVLEEAAKTVPAQILDPRQWTASGPLKEEGDVRSLDREITSRDGKIKWSACTCAKFAKTPGSSATKERLKM